MARASLTRRLLRNLSFEQVKKINYHFDLQPRKSKDELISQIVLSAGTDLSKIVSASGPFSLSEWNDCAEEIGGRRRKSFDEASNEIKFSLDPVYDDLDGDDNITNIRNDKRSLRCLANRLDFPITDLEKSLKETHGATLLSTFVKKHREHLPLENSKKRITVEHEIKIASSRIKTDHVEAIRTKWLAEHLKGSEQISIAAGYYDIDFIKSIFVSNNDVNKLRLVFNGLGGQRLKHQTIELIELRQELSRKIERVEIRLAFAPGIFHTKLFLASNGGQHRALIGSANATSAAFSGKRNEELLVGLPNSDTLAAYYENAWSSARDLGNPDKKCGSLIEFFRTGMLYFKPTSQLNKSINPFRELLNALPQSDRVLMGAIPLPYADREAPLGAFNLDRALRSTVDETSEEEREKDSNRTIKISIKPKSVETCYGYWVPSALNGELEEALSEVGAQKEERLLAFRAALNSISDTDLMEKYKEYLEAARKELGRLPNGAPEVSRDPYDLQPFQKFVSGIKKLLEDDARRKRLTHPFVSGAIPEFWDDKLAYEDFRTSFFEYLSHIEQKDAWPFVPGRILKAIATDEPSDAETLCESLEDYLTENGWDADDWKS